MKRMREHMERFVVLPFSIGCTSQSSVEVATGDPKKPKRPSTRRQEGEERPSKEKMRNTFGFLAFPKPNIASGIHKLTKGIKNLSQLFAYKEENDEMEREIEIGYPTDVKHVTHIGLDGTTTTNPVKGWENLKAPEIISFPSFSFTQFELAMAAQAHAPLVDAHASKLP